MATVATPGVQIDTTEAPATVHTTAVQEAEPETLTSAKQVAQLFMLAFAALAFNVACVAVAAFF